jgi:hypothetical protein
MQYILQLKHEDIGDFFQYFPKVPTPEQINAWFESDEKITGMQLIPLLNFSTLQYIKEKLRSI